jgi:lysozyme
MKLNNGGITFIKKFESCRLSAYKDSKGVWTVGWGHTGKDVDSSTTFTQMQADIAFINDASKAVNAVNNLVKQLISQNEFNALVSFVYNVGEGNFKSSTLLKELNNGNYVAAADEFPKWNHSGGIVVNGLTKRRLAEKALFESE